MCHCITCIQGPWGPECPTPLGLELPYGCWEWSLGLPREHSVLSALTCPASSSLPCQLLSCKHIGPRTTCFHLHGTAGAPSCAFALQLGLNEGQCTSWVPCDVFMELILMTLPSSYLIIQRIIVWTVYYIVIVVQGN